MDKLSRVEYRRIHEYIRRKMGKRPPKCAVCEASGREFRNGTWNIHWSNKDHKYSKDLDYWQPLCTDCHREYDSGLIGTRFDDTNDTTIL